MKTARCIGLTTVVSPMHRADNGCQPDPLKTPAIVLIENDNNAHVNARVNVDNI